jgi:hypothetical protein
MRRAPANCEKTNGDLGHVSTRRRVDCTALPVNRPDTDPDGGSEDDEEVPETPPTEPPPVPVQDPPAPAQSPGPYVV